MTDIARLGMDVDSSGLREGQAALRDLVSEGARAEGQISSQTKKKSASFRQLATRAGLALAAVGAGVTLAVRGQLNAIDDLAKSAQKIGIPVEHLSQLQHAADLSGVSMSSLETGLRRLSQNMAQDADKFDALGISVRDLDGNMRPTVDVMEDVANVLAAMPDGAEKTALAMDLMGRSGTEMIPMLNGGADAIRQMREEADRLGLTISQDTAEAAQNFNDNITRLTGASRGFWRQISAELAPTLERFSDIVVDLVNRFGQMSPRMRSLISNGGLLLAAMTPLVAVVGAFVGAIALVGAPVLAAAAGIAAITAAVVTFWPEIKAAGEAVREFAEDIGLLEALGIVWERLKEQVRNFRDLFVAIFEGDIPQIMESLVAIFQQPFETIMELWESDFAEPIRTLFTETIEWIQESFNGLVEWFTELPQRFLEIGRNIVQGLLNGFNEMWERFKDNIREKVDWMPNWVKNRLGIASPSRVFHEIGMNIGQGLSNGIDASFNLVRSAVERVGDVVTSSAFEMASGVVDAMGQMFQGSKPIAAAQALINTFQGITEALKLPFPASLAAAARVAAQGFAAVRGIQSARPGSSGGAASSSGGGSGGGASQSQAAQVATQRLRLEIVGSGPEADAAFRTLQLVQQAIDNGGRLDGVIAERVAG